MTKKLYILFSLLFVSLAIACAQDARSILDKSSAAYIQAGGISTSFTLSSKDTKTKATYSYDGKASLKGDKFKMEIADGITWFDGTTQWTYIKDSHEVNIITPSKEELQGISPSAIFSMYKQGFTLTLKGTKRVQTKTVYEIEMIAQNKKADIAKVTVQIDKATNLFSKIVIVDKSGLQSTLTINKMQTGLSLADALFKFDKKNYPQVEVIDLR